MVIIVMVVLVLWVFWPYDLDRKRHAEIRAELDRRGRKDTGEEAASVAAS